MGRREAGNGVDDRHQRRGIRIYRHHAQDTSLESVQGSDRNPAEIRLWTRTEESAARRGPCPAIRIDRWSLSDVSAPAWILCRRPVRTHRRVGHDQFRLCRLETQSSVGDTGRRALRGDTGRDGQSRIRLVSTRFRSRLAVLYRSGSDTRPSAEPAGRCRCDRSIAKDRISSLCGCRCRCIRRNFAGGSATRSLYRTHTSSRDDARPRCRSNCISTRFRRTGFDQGPFE